MNSLSTLSDEMCLEEEVIEGQGDKLLGSFYVGVEFRFAWN
jgi:hypothetical protein